MARMIRKQIVIDAAREALLERMATDRGVSQSEVVREAIDALANQDEGVRRRREAHERILRHFASNTEPLGLVDQEGNRTWKREDLYRR